MKRLIGLAAVVGVMACGPDTANLKESSYSVDQVFLNHDDSYTVTLIEPSGEVKPHHYGACISGIGTPFPALKDEHFTKEPPAGTLMNRGDFPCARAFKDLAPDAQGYIAIAEGNKFRYVEIHLAKNARIEPGTEIYGGKFRYEERMKEIK
jgi:hypothetical protein